MGIIHAGAPRELILAVKEKFGLQAFLECGTLHGATADWAADHFKRVVTVEFSKTLFDQNRNVPHSSNIEFCFGDSRQELRRLIPVLEEPSVIWLDSHWSGSGTYGEMDECPLLEEIAVINSAPITHFVLIDDARLFLSPPPKPHRASQWPSIDQVIEALKNGKHRYSIFVFQDIIAAVPTTAKNFVSSYCQEENTRIWESQQPKPAAWPLRKLKQGIKLVSGRL
jgi:hypothetical protein